MESQSRYEILDGLRGIAAIGVMLFHLSILGLPIAHHGYLAVDFFFMLSGFVLSHAYTNRLLSGEFINFLRQRLIRVFPLSTLGLALGSTYFLFRYFTQQKSLYGLGDILSATAFNAFLIPKPWITSAPTDTIFPSNTPLWSLSLEMFINFSWALFFVKIKNLQLFFIIVISAAFLVVFYMYHGTADIGATWPTYFGGVSRVFFGFFVGILIWRFRPPPTKSQLFAPLAAIILVFILMAPDFGTLFDIVAILIGFPVVVIAAISSNYRSERRLFRILGDISYPLYTIHVPIFMFAAGITRMLKAESAIYVVAIVAVITCLVAAFLLDRLYDRPLRRTLSKALARQ